MSQALIPNDLYVGGSLAAKQIVLSSGCVTDAAVEIDAGIQATKLEQQYRLVVNQDAGTNCATKTDLVHLVYAGGTSVASVVGFEAAVITPPTGADTMTIDFQRSTGGAAFASVLTAPITITSSTPARTGQSAAIAAAALNGGDLLQIVVTVNHSTGTQPQGLIAEAILRENPQ